MFLTIRLISWIEFPYWNEVGNSNCLRFLKINERVRMIIKQILLQAKTGTQHLKSGLKKKDIAETISNKNYRLTMMQYCTFLN